jgi:VanZ like family
MTRRFAFAAACACLAFIVFATLSHLHSRPLLISESERPIIVMFERFSAFAVLGFLASVSNPKRTALVCAIVFGSAIVLEFAQIFIPDRDARISDLIEKLAGGSVGIFAARWLVFRLQAKAN